MHIAGTVGNVRKWCTNSTLRFLTSGSFNSASIWLIGIGRQDVFYNCHEKWDAYWIGMDLGWFGRVCCPAAWELLRTGSTCPCQNMHRDIIPCNSLLGQKGVENSCWLESWMLSMAFHNAVWLISMVKIQELFPSCTGKTKETWTTANQVQSRYQEVCHLSAHVSIGHCWGSWQSVEVPQSLYFANFERAEVSILLPFDSLRFEGKISFTNVMGNEMLKATCRTKMPKVSTCSVKGNLCSLMLPCHLFLEFEDNTLRRENFMPMLFMLSRCVILLLL